MIGALNELASIITKRLVCLSEVKLQMGLNNVEFWGVLKSPWLMKNMEGVDKIVNQCFMVEPSFSLGKIF